MRQQTTVVSKSFAAAASFEADPDRQYMMIVVESGSATLALGGGDPFTITGFYEPLLPPINEFTLTPVGGTAVLITNQSTLNKQV